MYDAAPGTIRALSEFEGSRYTRVHHDALAGRVLDLMASHPAWHLPLGYQDGVFGAARVPSGAYLGERDLFLLLASHPARHAVDSEHVMKAVTKNMSLTPELNHFIDARVESRMYESVGDVVRGVPARCRLGRASWQGMAPHDTRGRPLLGRMVDRLWRARGRAA